MRTSWLPSQSSNLEQSVVLHVDIEQVQLALLLHHPQWGHRILHHVVFTQKWHTIRDDIARSYTLNHTDLQILLTNGVVWKEGQTFDTDILAEKLAGLIGNWLADNIQADATMLGIWGHSSLANCHYTALCEALELEYLGYVLPTEVDVSQLQDLQDYLSQHSITFNGYLDIRLLTMNHQELDVVQHPMLLPESRANASAMFTAKTPELYSLGRTVQVIVTFQDAKRALTPVVVFSHQYEAQPQFSFTVQIKKPDANTTDVDIRDNITVYDHNEILLPNHASPSDNGATVANRVEYEYTRAPHIAFLIDGDLPDNIYDEMVDTVNSIVKYLNNQNPKTRFASVVYGEYDAQFGKRKWQSEFDTWRTDSFVSAELFLQTIEHHPRLNQFSHDYCNALEAGIATLARLPWEINEPSFVILIGQSPPHPSDAEALDLQLPSHSVEEFDVTHWQDAQSNTTRTIRQGTGYSPQYLCVYLQPPSSPVADAHTSYAMQVWRQFGTDGVTSTEQYTPEMLNAIIVASGEKTVTEPPALPVIAR